MILNWLSVSEYDVKLSAERASEREKKCKNFLLFE